MRDHCSYDYAVVRVVPRVEREEFVNVGVIVYCQQLDFLDARIELDEGKLLAIDSTLDLDAVREHLASILRICRGGADAGPIGRLSPSERFRWLVSPRSTIIQTSPVHAGRCTDPADVLGHLIETMVQAPRRR